MGMAAGAGYIYVGGNGAIARHSMAGGPVTYLRAPGEAKDAIMLGSTLYTGQYSSQGIWTYDPTDGLPVRQAAEFPKEQNRPLDITWDATNKLVLVAAQSDTEGGGSLWTLDPATGASKHFINPIDNSQLLRAVVAQDGVAYLGGGGPGIADGGTIVACNPVTGTELWRITPQDAGTAALAIQGHNLYALSRKGTITVIDVRTRQTIHQASIKTLSYGFGAMVTNNGVVYGVSDTNVFRFDPFTFAVETVLADTKGGWYSGSHLTNDEAGNIYSLRGRNLVRLEVPTVPAGRRQGVHAGHRAQHHAPGDGHQHRVRPGQHDHHHPLRREALHRDPARRQRLPPLHGPRPGHPRRRGHRHLHRAGGRPARDEYQTVGYSAN